MWDAIFSSAYLMFYGIKLSRLVFSSEDIARITIALSLKLCTLVECGVRLISVHYFCPWPTLCKGQLLTWLILCQVETMRKRVSAADPAKCPSASEWDSITLEQFKQANLWTEGGEIFYQRCAVLCSVLK